MTRAITLIPGDGIGPEVTAAAVRMLEAAGLDVAWERHDAGAIAAKRPRDLGRTAATTQFTDAICRALDLS